MATSVDADAYEIVSRRVFDAPRDAVFRAFADPDQWWRWWGPAGFTNTPHQFDLRPGGAWRHTMHGPTGTDYPNEATFVEVADNERVVFDHHAPDFRMTQEFADAGGGTAVTWRMRFPSAAACDRLRGVCVPANEENFDRLADHLTGEAVAFETGRTLAAPAAAVFAAWTDTARLADWFGPKGCDIAVVANDPRRGGVMHYRLTTPDGGEMWGRWVYRELTPPGRLAFVASFSDAAVGITRAPFNPDWPREVLSVVTLAERDGATTLTLRGVPVNATAAERAAFAGFHASLRQGWAGTLDQLAAHLAAA